jgi:hypothetical protein
MLPYKHLAYYAELDEEGQPVYLDYDLKYPLLSKIDGTQLVLDFEKYPFCQSCVNMT